MHLNLGSGRAVHMKERGRVSVLAGGKVAASILCGSVIFFYWTVARNFALGTLILLISLSSIK